MSHTAEYRKRRYINDAILTARGLISRKNIDVDIYAGALSSSKGYLSLLVTFAALRRQAREEDRSYKEIDLLFHLNLFYAGVVFGRGETRSLEKEDQQTPSTYRSSEKSADRQAS